jgi:hypothetical protein
MAAAQYHLLSHRRYESTNSSIDVLIAVFHEEKTCRWVGGYRHDEDNFISSTYSTCHRTLFLPEVYNICEEEQGVTDSTVFSYFSLK